MGGGVLGHSDLAQLGEQDTSKLRGGEGCPAGPPALGPAPPTRPVFASSTTYTRPWAWEREEAVLRKSCQTQPGLCLP